MEHNATFTFSSRRRGRCTEQERPRPTTSWTTVLDRTVVPFSPLPQPHRFPSDFRLNTGSRPDESRDMRNAAGRSTSRELLPPFLSTLFLAARKARLVPREPMHLGAVQGRTISLPLLLPFTFSFLSEIYSPPPPGNFRSGGEKKDIFLQSLYETIDTSPPPPPPSFLSYVLFRA